MHRASSNLLKPVGLSCKRFIHIRQVANVKCATGSNSTSPASKKRRRSTTTSPSEDARAGLLSEALHLLQRSQAVGESGIEALNGEEGVQELDNTIVGADATIKAWRFMQVTIAAAAASLQGSFCISGPVHRGVAVSCHAALLLWWQLTVIRSCCVVHSAY